MVDRDLIHRWKQPDPKGNPTLWECDCLIQHRGIPPNLLCPNLVEEMRSLLRKCLEELDEYWPPEAHNIGCPADPNGDCECLTEEPWMTRARELSDSNYYKDKADS